MADRGDGAVSGAGSSRALHPDALIFPLMPPEEYEVFADDIEANGLLEPITLRLGEILDGVHRERACAERGVEARYVEWDESCGLTTLEWVISKNLSRRQLSASQRTALAVELKDRLGKSGRERMSAGGRHKPSEQAKTEGRSNSTYLPAMAADRRSGAIAGKQFGVSHTTVTALAAVRKADKDMFDRVKAGEITTESARRLVGLGPSGGRKPHQPKTRVDLKVLLAPLRRYLKNWEEARFYGLPTKEARRLLKQVQEVNGALFEVERALEARTTLPRALT